MHKSSVEDAFFFSPGLGAGRDARRHGPAGTARARGPASSLFLEFRLARSMRADSFASTDRGV